jgi:hypothetical protein
MSWHGADGALMVPREEERTHTSFFFPFFFSFFLFFFFSFFLFFFFSFFLFFLLHVYRSNVWLSTQGFDSRHKVLTLAREKHAQTCERMLEGFQASV